MANSSWNRARSWSRWEHACTMQGFFLQLGIMAPMYNGFLALYCFLYVCKSWSKQRMNHIEMFGHISIIAFGLSVSIAGIPLGIYNNSVTHCFIAPFPYNCTRTSYEGMDNSATATDCTRGNDAIIYRWVFFYGVVWVNILLTFFSMSLVYIQIRKQEKRMEAYTNEYTENNNSARRKSHSDSREFAVRGALFTGSFIITWVPVTIAASFFTTGILFEYRRHFLLALVTMMLTPSQGIFNFFIYIWPSLSQRLKEKKTTRRDDKLQKNDQVAKNAHNSHKDGYQSNEEKQEIVEDVSPTSS